jgi:hypothetical protein
MHVAVFDEKNRTDAIIAAEMGDPRGRDVLVEAISPELSALMRNSSGDLLDIYLDWMCSEEGLRYPRSDLSSWKLASVLDIEHWLEIPRTSNVDLFQISRSEEELLGILQAYSLPESRLHELIAMVNGLQKLTAFAHREFVDLFVFEFSSEW